MISASHEMDRPIFSFIKSMMRVMASNLVTGASPGLFDRFVRRRGH
jgi:hypothetical protein